MDTKTAQERKLWGQDGKRMVSTTLYGHMVSISVILYSIAQTNDLYLCLFNSIFLKKLKHLVTKLKTRNSKKQNH